MTALWCSKRGRTRGLGAGEAAGGLGDRSSGGEPAQAGVVPPAPGAGHGAIPHEGDVRCIVAGRRGGADSSRSRPGRYDPGDGSGRIRWTGEREFLAVCSGSALPPTILRQRCVSSAIPQLFENPVGVLKVSGSLPYRGDSQHVGGKSTRCLGSCQAVHPGAGEWCRSQGPGLRRPRGHRSGD
jgi:hypothetical protein